MASSDDEGETCPDVVSEYYFCDGEDEPLSFANLPVQWNESSSPDERQIFLRGTADNGLQKLYKPVKAWKYDFSKVNPEILVLSKDNHWIKLQKPRKSYEKEIRTILITVQCLYFLKTEPEASGKALWDHLSKVFSLYDIRPSENDLIDHMNFIREAVKRDESLAKSKFLASFLDNPRKRKFPDEDAETATKPSFIVDDMNDELQDDDFITKQTEDSESDEEEDHFDSVCAICDNGGALTCCEGKCFRSFHASADSEEAEESNCESLGLPPGVVEGKQPFCCENCLYNRHQCFVCGELGSSDKSLGAEVFRCSSATCGHFYHPRCVASLLQQCGEAEPHELEEKIAAGEPFICPAHRCVVCSQTENEKVKDLQFAICRRCPTSYHRKCLPRKIMFDHQVDDDDDVPRAWDDLLPKSRALIYCLKHEIDEELGTPARTLKFRNIGKSKVVRPSELQAKKKKVAVKEASTYSEYTSKKTAVLKSKKGIEKSSAVKPEDSSKKRAAGSSGPESLKKKKTADISKNSLRRTLSTKVKTPSSNDSQPSLGSRLYDYMQKGTESSNWEKDDTSIDDDKQTMAAKSPENEILSPIDADSKQRILALMKDAASSITLDEVKKYHKGKVPSTHAHSSRVDKSIILARVEGSVEALHLALKKLEEGCSVEDAMAVCEPFVLNQIMRWKEKLRVYLAPFLHGMRYTSFGRHFTKVEKLEKIIDKLQWYVEDGDMVVDFCCGANDFSCLVKKRLDQMGKKKCSFKNYDIARPKNDFNFEKRDWMSVNGKELPRGSRLIMGLNPPFGVNASLANQFIEKALRFKPKLLILIVPPETERLDSEKQQMRYDLVWEDVELLAGKAFYLPGSVDVNDKQMDQWNHTPPPLYLWSRPDWTDKHKAIAQKHGHIPGGQEAPCSRDNVDRPLPLHDIPVSEPTTDKAKPDTKRSKRESPAHDVAGTETKKQQQITSTQTSSKRNHRDFKHDARSFPSPPRQDQVQTHDEKPSSAPSRHRKHEEKHSLESAPSRKHDEKHSSCQDLVRKHDDKHSPAPSRQDLARKHDDKPSSTPSRQDQARKHDDKHSLPPPRQDEALTSQDEALETFLSDFDLGNVGQLFDQPLERRYNSTAEESGFSFRNDVGLSVDQHLEGRYSSITDEHLEGRYSSITEEHLEGRYSSITEEPYMGSTYRRLEGATPSYSIRPDHAQYPGYDRVGRGSYFDEMNARGGYMSSHHEPGLSRYGPPDTTPYNRTSTSTMQRYAPRLDELNHTRINNFGRPELDELNHTRTNNFGRPELDELHHSRMGLPEPPMANRYGPPPPLPVPGYRAESMGFAPGPYHPYSQRNSSGGWLNE